MPGIPRAPRKRGSGASDGSTLIAPAPSLSAYSCTPKRPLTVSPSAKSGCCEAITRPIPSARITSPISTGGCRSASR